MMKNTSLVLSACCLAMLSVGDNSTAVMAALPAMTRDLQLDSAAVEWVVNAYLLAAAVFILSAARRRIGLARGVPPRRA
jgi:MFS family permease